MMRAFLSEKNMESEEILKQHLLTLLEGKGAHADFEKVIKDIPPKYYGKVIKRLPYSLWQILEHIRFTQHDILDYMVSPYYEEPNWPDAYWPSSPEPPSDSAWEESVKQYRNDLSRLKEMLNHKKLNVLKFLPHGNEGHTYLREFLLVADHTSYHLGEMVLIRRLLKIWND